MTTNRRQLRELLRQSTSRLVELTVEGSLTWGELLSDPGVAVDISGLGAVVADWREGTSADHWSGVLLLANWAPTPIVVHGEHFASVESFYNALKYPEGSSERASVATQSGPAAQYQSRRHRGTSFPYRGLSVAVGSPQHAAIIAEAVVAKVGQHASILAALRSTGRATLTFPDGTAGKGTLAQATPLALMIERSRRQGAAA